MVEAALDEQLETYDRPYEQVSVAVHSMRIEAVKAIVIADGEDRTYRAHVSNTDDANYVAEKCRELGVKILGVGLDHNFGLPLWFAENTHTLSAAVSSYRRI